LTASDSGREELVGLSSNCCEDSAQEGWVVSEDLLSSGVCKEEAIEVGVRDTLGTVQEVSLLSGETDLGVTQTTGTGSLARDTDAAPAAVSRAIGHLSCPCGAKKAVVAAGALQAVGRAGGTEHGAVGEVVALEAASAASELVAAGGTETHRAGLAGH
jgi:hypothetical protein